MKIQRTLFILMASLLTFVLTAQSHADPVKYCRFQSGDTVAYGIVEGDVVTQLSGDLFGEWEKTETTFPLEKVTLLVPTTPTQVLALAGNYRSHLADEDVVTTIITTVTTIETNQKTKESTKEAVTTTETRRSGEVPEKFQIPQPFFKSPSCLLPDGGAIVIPKDATTVHYEAELVVVIGKKCKNVSPEDAAGYVFGITCGNDISERVWQKSNVQWWRAKGSDTFGPCGPFIVSGLDYNDLEMQLRINGEVKQKERTSMLIHDVAHTVSHISQYVTLHPGDLLFTGTPGQTDVLKPGDTVEIEIEGVGVLKNSVIADD